jgi:hypothetical protein
MYRGVDIEPLSLFSLRLICRLVLNIIVCFNVGPYMKITMVSKRVGIIIIRRGPLRGTSWECQPWVN